MKSDQIEQRIQKTERDIKTALESMKETRAVLARRIEKIDAVLSVFSNVTIDTPPAKTSSALTVSVEKRKIVKSKKKAKTKTKTKKAVTSTSSKKTAKGLKAPPRQFQTEAYSEDFKNKIVAIALSGRMTQAELAKASGVSQGTLSRWTLAAKATRKKN